MGTSQEDDTEEGDTAGRLGKVLSHSDTGGVVVCGGYLGFVSYNSAEAGRSSCGVPETGDEIEGKKAKGRIVAEGGGGKSASGC